MNNDFWHFLKNTLTAHQYEQLAGHIGCGPKRLTRIEKGSTDFILEEVVALAQLLELLPTELIMQHHVGEQKITLAQARLLAAKEGKELRIEYPAT